MSNRLWIALVGAVVMLMAAPAAALANTVSVSPTGTDGPACGTNVSPCKTITAALDPVDGNAGTGDTVSVAAGTYVEQVTITKGVTLIGAGVGQTIIKAPARPLATCVVDPLNGSNVQPMVCVNAASAPVTVQNLTIDASSAGSDAGCGSDVEGIYSLNSAVTIQSTDIEHARLLPRSSLGGCQAGAGIRIVNHDGTARNVVVKNNTVNDYQKGGIEVRGAGVTFTISGNTLTEDPASDIGPNGIEVGESGSGTISGNTVSGDECNQKSGGCDVANPITGVQSAAILLFDTGTVSVSNNTVSGNDVGIFQGDCSVAQGCPGYSGTPSNVTVTGNTLSNNRYEGLYAGAGTTNASGNKITGSAIGVENASFNSPSPDPSNAVLNLTGNSITNNGTALQLDVDTAGPEHPVSTAHDNAMTNNGKGITNNTSQPVNASDNLITCDAGSGSACVTGSGVTTSELKLKISAARAQIGIPNQTTTVTAELVDSAGKVVSGAAVPDGSRFGFAASLGSIPANAGTTNGVATATLTSGATNGTSVVAVGFDDQAATTSVVFGTPAGPVTITKTKTKTLPLIITGGTAIASKHGVLTFEAANPGSSAVAVTITLTIRQHGRNVTVAKTTRRIGAHRTLLVRLTLSKSALKTLLKRHSLKLTETTAAFGLHSSSPLKVRL